MRLRRCIARTFLAVLLTAPAGALYAQNITGTILGRVTDATGAAVANAEVVATAQATNQAARTATNETGYYELSYLQPGSYSLKVAAAGFKTIVRDGVPVAVDSRVRLEFSVEVGDASTSIAVVGQAPLVESDKSSLSQVVTTRSVVDLPIKGRNIFDLASLSPGVNVNPRAQGAVASTGDNSAPLFVMSDISINGGRYRTNDYLLDGVSIMLPENNDFAVSPTPDGTQEFQILTNSAGPQFGRSGGGVLNVITRSGTNQWHGSAYEFFRNDRTEANNFFANAHNQARGPFHFNLFGASAGAPVRKDKTFVFAEYQGHRARSTLGGQLATLPTALQRQGDFSQTLNQAGQLVTLYDPGTTQPNGSAFIRTAYPGNRIPASQINPVALKMMPFIPLPNQPGTGFAGVNNFAWAQQAFINSDQWSVRVDQHFSDRHSFFGRVTRNTGNSGNTGPFNNVADNVLGIDVSHVINSVLNDTLTLNATTLLNIRFGVTRRYEGRAPIHGGVDLTSLGFPASLAAAATQQVFPAMSFANYTAWGDPSGDPIRRGNDIYTLVGDTTWVRGRHTLIYGADVRLYNQTPYQGGPDAGAYSFSQGFTQGPNPLVSSLNAGDGFASFLVGYGSGSISRTPALAIRNWYAALYFNDEIKLGKVTINAGLRWDYEFPRTERYNRFSTFDFSTAFPVQVPGLTALKGVLTHPGQNGAPRGQFDTYGKAFGPRVGIAWAAAPKTAVRAGYGLFYSPRFGTTSAGNFGSAGATINTSWVASVDGVTPLNSISNPFPTGIFQAPVTTADQVLLGQGILFMDRRNLSNTYNQQWNLNIQRELAGGFLVEAGYAGNRGVHLPVGIDFDQINPTYQSLGAGLSAQVPNPFFGLVSTGVLSTRTVAQSQLLRPYPQYTSLSTSSPAVAENEGNSLYHALQLKFDKRSSKGVAFLVSYTASKVIDSASGRIFGVNGFVPPVQNIYNLKAERSISEGDISQQLVISHTIELPFGRGKALFGNAPAIVNSLIGGWSVNGTLTMFTGFPLALTSTGNSGVGSAVLRPNSTGTSAALSGSVESRLNRFFDIAQFTVPAPYTFGNVSRTLADVRSPGRRNYDLALQKRFALNERVSILFRTEAFNLTNTPYFAGPGVALGSGTFGVISAASGDRQIQFSLKALF